MRRSTPRSLDSERRSRERELEIERLAREKRKRAATEKLFHPQPGPQTAFYEADADIVVYGGAAGGGKTYALLLEAIRHVDNAGFGAVIFRRTSPEITAQGGLWDNACALYPLRGGKPIKSPQMQMRFASGARVEFRHLQYEEDVYAWQGAQVPLLCFDELTHFTRKQFFYLLSRNRSTCGVRPYIRATTNPDADSWVAEFIAWWLDEDSGLPLYDRSGVVRYFVVLDDVVRWGDSREELAASYGVRAEDTKSFTFIASSIFDNRILLEKNPEYLANLNAQNTVDKARLLHGNWKIRPSAGMYFARDRVIMVPSVPRPIVAICRAWDLAATPATPLNMSPDATAGTLIARMDDGRYIVLDCVHGRWAPNDVRSRVRAVATADKDQFSSVRIRLPQDPGQAGKEQALSYVSFLAGFFVKTERPTGDKITRAEPFSAQWQAGNVVVLAGPWNNAYFAEMEAFPDGAHDDVVDASSDAFAEVALGAPLVIARREIVDPGVDEYGSSWRLGRG